MENTIEACAVTNANLIFFATVYMYGPSPLDIPFDENSTKEPTTKKGLARKKTTDLLLKAIADKRVNAVIGRSADFYGPYAVNSPFYISFLQRMLAGKSPLSISKKGIAHTYSDTTDIGKAFVALATDRTTYSWVWHLPTGRPISVEEVTKIFNKELGADFQTSYMPSWLREFLSLFISPLKEAGEMLYQFNAKNIISSEKFKKHFPDFIITSYAEGIKEMTNSFKNNLSSANKSIL